MVKNKYNLKRFWGSLKFKLDVTGKFVFYTRPELPKIDYFRNLFVCAKVGIQGYRFRLKILRLVVRSKKKFYAYLR